eukprot:COSAG02_NODE_412_length_22836_cov_41.209966_4_plen_932_part_00
MVCCGSKPAPSPRGPVVSAVSAQEAEQQARVVALQAEKIKLLEEQVASLRQVTSASSSGSTPSPPAVAARGVEPAEPAGAPELRDAPPLPTERRRSRLKQQPAQPPEPQPPALPSAQKQEKEEEQKEAAAAGEEVPVQCDDGNSSIADDDAAVLTADEQVALANIERLSLQMDPPAVGSVSFQSSEVCGQSKLSTILSAGSQEQQSEPLNGSAWCGSYGSIGAAVAEESQRDEEDEDMTGKQREVQVEAVTVELDPPAVPEELAVVDSGGTQRQQRRVNANGFQMRVQVPDDDEEVDVIADGAGGRERPSSVDSCSSAPGISPAVSDGTMEDILAVAEESSQDEESLLDELEASVVVEAESDMALLATAAEEARQAEEAVVAKRGEHSPISKSTSAKRREIERMLAEAHAEVSALKARRDGLLDEDETFAVLSHTPPRSDRTAKADWYSSDSSSEDGTDQQSRDAPAGSVPVMETGGALEVEDGFETAALDLEAAAAVVGGKARETSESTGLGDNAEEQPAVEVDDGAIMEELHVGLGDEAAIASASACPDDLIVGEHCDTRDEQQDDRVEQLRLARIQASEDRRLAKERQDREKAAAAEELALGALVADAEVGEEEDPVAAAKRAKVLEKMAKRSEERAEKLRQAKEERAARASATAATNGVKKPKRVKKSAAAKRNKPAKPKELGPTDADVDDAMEALQAGNQRTSAAARSKGARPASGRTAAAAERRAGRSNRPASAGDATAPAKKQTKVSTRPASGGGRGGGTVKTSKAVLAVQEMEKKREARRAKALRERNRKEAEIAEHGDVKNLHYRRQLDEFRQQLDAGKSGISLPKYRRKAESRVKVCVRKRPLLGAQQEDTAFDVLSTIGGHTLLCHEPRQGVDGRQTFEHHPFLFDAVFGDSDGGAEVYERAVVSLPSSLQSCTMKLLEI